MTHARQLEIESRNGVTLILLGPAYENLDESLMEECRHSLLEATRHAEPPRVVLDLSHTRFFGSAFIEVLFRAWKDLTSRGGVFALSGLTPYCREIVEITHLDRLWTIYPDRDAAVAALGN